MRMPVNAFSRDPRFRYSGMLSSLAVDIYGLHFWRRKIDSVEAVARLKPEVHPSTLKYTRARKSGAAL